MNIQAGNILCWQALWTANRAGHPRVLTTECQKPDTYLIDVLGIQLLSEGCSTP